MQKRQHTRGPSGLGPSLGRWAAHSRALAWAGPSGWAGWPRAVAPRVGRAALLHRGRWRSRVGHSRAC
jgi:hypothetical protein